MARPLRIQFPGAFYHITSRGNERKEIFRSKADREQFLSYLESAHHRYGALIHVYCLMANHYHLLLETPRGNLSQILHHLNGAYTTYFNSKRKRTGHLFQGRYKAIVVEKDAYCQELSGYIHLNPIRAGVAETPEAYRWSSYRSYIGKEKCPEWLTTDSVLGSFGQDHSAAQRHYQEFVEGTPATEMSNPLRDVVASTFLANAEFIDRVRQSAVESKSQDMRDVPALRELTEKPSLEHIEEAVKSIIGNDHPLYRKLCIYLGHQHTGLSLTEIGEYFGMRGPAVSQASRRFRQDITDDKNLKKLILRIMKGLGGDRVNLSRA